MLNLHALDVLLEQHLELYKDPRVPPPPQYKLQDYIDPNRVNGVHEKGNNYGLTPLSQDDMMRYAVKPGWEPEGFDRLHDMEGMRNVQTMNDSGRDERIDNKPFEVGVRPQISDEEFKKYTGITW